MKVIYIVTYENILTYDAIAQRPGDFLNKISVLSSIFSCGISRIPLLNVMSNSEFFPGFLNFTPD